MCGIQKCGLFVSWNCEVKHTYILRCPSRQHKLILLLKKKEGHYKQIGQLTDTMGVKELEFCFEELWSNPHWRTALIRKHSQEAVGAAVGPAGNASLLESSLSLALITFLCPKFSLAGSKEDHLHHALQQRNASISEPASSFPPWSVVRCSSLAEQVIYLSPGGKGGWEVALLATTLGRGYPKS